MSLTDFFDAASRRHNDVILLPAIRIVSGNDFVPAGQCTDTPRRVRATVELLRQVTRSPASAGIANRPLVFLGIFLIFGSNTPTWSVENQLHY